MKVSQEGVKQFTVRVTPRASKSEVRCVDGGINVRLTAAPVDGAANEACIKLIAETLGVAKSHVSIVNGLKSRTKVIAVEWSGDKWPWATEPPGHH